MKMSSFFFGVVLGATASMIMAKKRNAMMSQLGQMGGSKSGATDKAKDKILGMAFTGFGNTAASTSNADNSANNESKSSANEQKADSPVKSKESNLKMLKDFIHSDPDVKHQVEQILKETRTTIPGL